MLTLSQKRSGFTIVELLIVIVVIAILAAISVAAYTGIQNRANDSAVQSDINNFSKKIMLYHAEFGEYPAGNGGDSPPGIGRFALARSSYSTNVHNFYYCTGTVSGNPSFAVGAVSKSGNMFYFSSLNGGTQVYAGAWGGIATICPGMLTGVAAGYTRSYGHDTGSGWFSWTQ